MSDSAVTFSAEELARGAGGRWTDGRGTAVSGVFTDTRQDGSGRLFIALSGENFDAHDFRPAAVSAGAAALCVAESKLGRLPEPCPVPVLAVADPLRSYQGIARLHRRRFPELTVAAVTGSVGKTSVKEMLRAIFTAAAGAERVLYTVGNTNNQVGVPQNLLRLQPQHRFAVIEMGTNHHGEIEPLSCCALPQVALVNSIAPCHLEFLGSLEGIAREKSRIFSGLPADGTAVIPRSCPAVEVLAEAAAPFRLLRFGEGSGCAVEAHYCGGRLEGSSFELRFADGERFEISWSLTGRHQAVNAAAAAAAALAAGIAPAVIAEGLERTVLPGMRGKLVRSGGVTYLNDAYNANPGSMRAAFEHLAEFADPGKLILLLGEMRELGPESEAAHREIYGLAARLFPGARIVTVGDGFRNAGGGEHFASAADARRVTAEAKPGDLVFAKGSRGIGVEAALPEEAR